MFRQPVPWPLSDDGRHSEHLTLNRRHTGAPLRTFKHPLMYLERGGGGSRAY